MPTVAEVVAALATRLRPELAAPWDPVGLQLGDPGATVESVAVCHEVTEAVVGAVESNPPDLLVSYHPLLFVPTTAITAGRSPSARAFRLLRAGVNLLITHTDFDVAPGGAADALAGALGLTEVGAFGEEADIGVPAIGRVGRFSGSLGDLVDVVTENLGDRGLRVSGDRGRSVHHVAAIPGSGSDLIGSAAALADVVVTGDVSHHRVVEALDLGLSVIDPGHIATERPGILSLVAMVGEAIGTSLIDLSYLDPETWS